MSRFVEIVLNIIEQTIIALVQNLYCPSICGSSNNRYDEFCSCDAEPNFKNILIHREVISYFMAGIDIRGRQSVDWYVGNWMVFSITM